VWVLHWQCARLQKVIVIVLFYFDDYYSSFTRIHVCKQKSISSCIIENDFVVIICPQFDCCDGSVIILPHCVVI
jgi:hypothetical protein